MAKATIVAGSVAATTNMWESQYYFALLLC
jgi:hypothetical protein